jgi:hypothetical protein
MSKLSTGIQLIHKYVTCSCLTDNRDWININLTVTYTTDDLAIICSPLRTVTHYLTMTMVSLLKMLKKGLKLLWINCSCSVLALGQVLDTLEVQMLEEKRQWKAQNQTDEGEESN